MSDIAWVAHYSDGTQVKQTNEDVKYPDLDREKLIAFDLWENSKLVLRLDLRPDELGRKHLVWRMRSQIRTNGTKDRIHLAGWFRDDESLSMCYVFEDGSIMLGGQWREEDFMYPVVLMECEKNGTT